MTPAQADGNPNFVVDVPVQGPTDEGMRAGSCWWAQNRLPARPACVDCGGPIPMWAQHSLSTGSRLSNSGLGEPISFGGAGVAGFSLGAPGDPDVYSKMSADQQAWVQNTLVALNTLIQQSSGTTCPTWAPNIDKAGACFQVWWNANFAGSGKPGKPLRVDGVFDEDTLCALITIAGMHPNDFKTAFPDPSKQHCQPPAPLPSSATAATAAAKPGLSTGEMVGIGLGGAVLVGGIVYAATRGGHGRKAKRRR